MSRAKRKYGQFCGLAQALDIVGERWTLLIVRDLALGARRYSDLLEGLPGIGTGLLAERLRQLEEEGIARKARLAPPAGVTVYELTDDGAKLADAVLPLAAWGAERLPEHSAGDAIYRADWLLFAVRARFDAARSAGVRELYEFLIDDQVVHVRVDDGTVEARRGPAPIPPDLVVETDPPTLYALGTGRLDVTEAVRSGRARVEGSHSALNHCLEILAGTPGPPAARAGDTPPPSRRRGSEASAAQ